MEQSGVQAGSEAEEIHQIIPSVALLQKAWWGVADQALSSLTNFGLGIVVVRALGPAGLGSFTIMFATYTLALAFSRAVTSEPLMVHYSAPPHVAWRSGTAQASGAALLVGVAFGLGCVLVACIGAGVLTRPLIALGLTLPGLLVQDCWRYAFFARGRGFSAFLNDLARALVLFPLLLMVLRTNTDSATWLVLLCWGGAATLAAVFGVHQSGIVPAWQLVLDWVRQERGLIPRFLGEAIALSGAAQVAFFTIGAIAGLAALGTLRAAQLIFGPIQVLFMGIGAMAIPELVSARQHSRTRLLWTSRLFSLALAGTALVWGGLALALPSSLGVALLGRAWHAARLLVIAILVFWVARGLTAGAAAGLRSLAAATQSFGARLVGSLLAVASVIGGTVAAGVRGAAWGLALAAWVEALVWWWQYERTMRKHDDIAQDELSGTRNLPADPQTVAQAC